jgi:hypothetical protein
MALSTFVFSGCGGGEEPGSRPAAATSSSASASTSTQASAPSTTAPAPAAGASTTGQVTTSSPPGASSQPTGQSAARADAICVKRNRELKRAPIVGGGMSVLASNASRRATIEREALAELSALTPPAGVAEPWKTMIEQTRATLAEVTKLASAAHAGDDAAVTRAISAATRPRLRLLASAANAGAKHCINVG